MFSRVKRINKRNKIKKEELRRKIKNTSNEEEARKLEKSLKSLNQTIRESTNCGI